MWVNQTPIKEQNLGVAFKTKNTIGKVLNVKKIDLPRTKYENSSVYRHRCLDCNFVHTGQTGRQFKIRYNEQLLAFNNNNNNNNICLHPILNHLTPNGHYVGRTAQLTSRCCILYIYSTNIRTEYFKHAA